MPNSHLPYQPRPPKRAAPRYFLAGLVTGLTLAGGTYALAAADKNLAALLFGIFLLLPAMFVTGLICLALDDNPRQFGLGLLLATFLALLLVSATCYLR